VHKIATALQVPAVALLTELKDSGNIHNLPVWPPISGRADNLPTGKLRDSKKRRA
jgi:hypothetical protein